MESISDYRFRGIYKALNGCVEKHIWAKNVSWKNIYRFRGNIYSIKMVSWKCIYGLKAFRGKIYIGFVERHI